MPTIYCIGGPNDGQPVDTDPLMPNLAIDNPKTGQQGKYTLRTYQNTGPTGNVETNTFYVSVDLQEDEAHQRAIDLGESIRRHKGLL